MRQVLLAIGVCAVCVSPAFAQSRLETDARWVQNLFGTDKSPKAGFYAEFGALPPGSGISGGPGYRRPLFGGNLVVDGSASASWSRGTLARVNVELPRLANDHVSAGVQFKRQDFTRLGYFGIGPDSAEADATDYGFKNTDYLGYVAVKSRTWLTVGGRLGYSRPVAIQRPRATAVPATQDLFTDATAPGLLDRPAFLHGDAYVTMDTRNHASRPTSGGDYRVTWSAYDDRDFGTYSFRRIEAEASRFIPIFHDNSVIALRGRVASSDTSAGNVVPFYLLPTLGGSRSLRGYDDYRFRDRDLLMVNAEYRWRVLHALDAALFYDGGKVAPRFGDLDLNRLKSSYGAGLRFHSTDATFFRMDVGHSREGTRVLVSFTEALRPGRGSISVPYVP